MYRLENLEQKLSHLFDYPNENIRAIYKHKYSIII